MPVLEFGSGYQGPTTVDMNGIGVITAQLSNVSLGSQKQVQYGIYSYPHFRCVFTISGNTHSYLLYIKNNISSRSGNMGKMLMMSIFSFCHNVYNYFQYTAIWRDFIIINYSCCRKAASFLERVLCEILV